MEHRNHNLQRNEEMIEQFSIDKRFLMIHPHHLKKLTPTLRAPQISRQPSFKHIDFFDLQNPYHAEILCQRLHDLRAEAEMEEHKAETLSSSDVNDNTVKEEVPLEVGIDSENNEARIFMSYR